MIRISSSGLFALLLLAVAAIAVQGAPWRGRRMPLFIAQSSPSATTSAGADTSTTLRANEQSFLRDAIETGRDVADVARLAVSQANTTGVRDLAQQLVGDYAQINSSLETLARRKATEIPPSPTGFPSDYRELADRSGANFDRAYIRAATAASARELRLFEAAVANAKDTDLRDLAGGLLPVLRDHVNKLTDLQKGL